MAEKERGSQLAYERKMLKKVYAAVSSDTAFKEDQRTAGEEFDLNWFNDLERISIFLFAKSRINVNPAHVLSTNGFTKTALWEEFFVVRNRLKKGQPAAMFFPIVHMGGFVIHTASFLDMTPGQNILVRQGSTAATILRVEPIKAFLKAIELRFR